MDQYILAKDATGLFSILKLRPRTGVGHVIQVLDSTRDSGLHRTWHASGYVHDRSTNPPSTVSTGMLQPPATAIRELWARHVLEAGALAAVYGESLRTIRPGDVLVDLVGGPPIQRVDVWYTSHDDVSSLQASIRTEAAGRLMSIAAQDDGGVSRVVAVLTPGPIAT